MNDFTGTPGDGGPAAQEGGTQQARAKTSSSPGGPDPILLTFTGRKSGGFIGKKLLGSGRSRLAAEAWTSWTRLSLAQTFQPSNR